MNYRPKNEFQSKHFYYLLTYFAIMKAFIHYLCESKSLLNTIFLRHKDRTQSLPKFCFLKGSNLYALTAGI